MKENLKLFGVFFRIGLFLFGGGYSMLPLLQREIVDKNGWATQEEVLDYFAIGQCMPGIIAVNTSMFIGYKHKGTFGAIIAMTGAVFPSLIVITVIAALFENFADFKTVQHALSGIRVAAGALITTAVIRLIKSDVRSIAEIVLCVAAFVVVAVFKSSPVFVVIGASLFGIIYGFGRRKE